MLIFCFLGTGMFSCTHKRATPVPDGDNNKGNGSITPDTGLCFERDILPIFISSCAKSGCHDAVSRQDGFAFTSWQTITSRKFVPGRPDKTELYEKITADRHDKRMPPNTRLTQQQIALIRTWIEHAAPNTVNCTTGGCDSAQHLYSTSVKPVLANNCKECHNSSFASGGYFFENYNTTPAVISSGRFLGAVKQQGGYRTARYEKMDSFRKSE